MNIFNKGLLKLLLLPNKFYSNNGINTAQLKSILTAKLLMDDRRPNTLMQAGRQKQKKQVSMATLQTMFISALMGGFFLFSFSFDIGIALQLTFYFSYFIFMLASTLIADFTSVLIDVRDNYIILPKPVNDRTVLLARLLHIFIHICKLVVPMLLPGLVFMAYNFGVAGAFLFALLGLFAVVFTIFLINAVYIFILRITTPEKFKTIISYIQIFFAIVLYSSFQLIPRLVGRFGNIDVHLINSYWLLLLPSYWFAAAWDVCYNLHGTMVLYIATTLALLLPFTSLWVVIRFLAPSFNRRLSLISSTSSEVAPVAINTTQKITTRKKSFAASVAKLFTKQGAERMGFLITWYMTARSRDFKMKVYPSIGYFIVYIFIMAFTNKSFSLYAIQQQEGAGKVITIITLYFSSFLLIMAIPQLTYSDKYKAAWLYFVSPVKLPGSVLNGAVKAAIVKFFAPAVLLFAITGIALIGISFIPNLLLAIVNQAFTCYMIVYLSYRELPFSKSQSMQVKTGNFLRNIFSMLIPITLGILHYFIYNSMPLIIICFVLASIAVWMAADSVKKLTWLAVKSVYSEE